MNSNISIKILRENKERTVIIEKLTEQIKERLNGFSDTELTEMDSKLTQLLEMLADSESNFQLLNEILKTLWVK